MKGIKYIFFVFILSVSFANAAEDLREYQHGINFVPHLSDNKFWLIWSSSGNPPTGASGNWKHDIYYSKIDPANPVISPKTIISNDEAQEPASSAANSFGNIMITNEDGWNTNNEVAQRYGVYTNEMAGVKAYPQMVLDGGHSGHVAAAGTRFVVFYSEGWVDGGGVDNLGSGDDVYVKVYDGNGTLERSYNVAVGNSTRDWWPVVASSPTRSFLLWQRFINGSTVAQLMYVIYDPTTGSVVKAASALAPQATYYTYDVEYISALDRFLVTGTDGSGKGFAYLLDGSGNVTAQLTGLQKTIRESQPAILDRAGTSVAVVPAGPSGALVLAVTASNISLVQTISDSYQWQYMGTDGVFFDPTHVYIVSLSKSGLVEKKFTINEVGGGTPTPTPTPTPIPGASPTPTPAGSCTNSYGPWVYFTRTKTTFP